MHVYALGWSLASQFWSFDRPPKNGFPRPKKRKFPIPIAIGIGIENQNSNSNSKLLFLNNQNFGVFCLCGEINFVTPFSNLANIKGSLPTKSTTPGRLRSWIRTQTVQNFPVWGFEVRTFTLWLWISQYDYRQKKIIYRGSQSNPDLHIQKKSIAEFSRPGGQYSRDKCSMMLQSESCRQCHSALGTGAHSPAEGRHWGT